MPVFGTHVLAIEAGCPLWTHKATFTIATTTRAELLASSISPIGARLCGLRHGVLFEEADQLLAQRVVLGVLEHRGARRAGAGTGPRGCRRARAAGPLVIIATRSDRNSASSTSCVTISAVLRSARPELDQHLLQLEARQRVEHAERLVEQQHLGIEREGARDARRAGACPPTARRAACAWRRPGRRARGSASAIAARSARGASGLHLRRRRACTLSSAVSHGSRHGAWNTTPRSGPGPVISLSSTSTPPSVGGSRPATIDSTVDLPQPEWPIRQTNSPLRDARGRSRAR